MTCDTGASWKMIYTGQPPTPDHEIYQCKKCTEENGLMPTDFRIKPECSVGFFK